jgi:hypothetical protein
LTLLLDWLRDKQMVLILDNCEHLLAACAAFADAVLRSCPQVRLLATSREALGMAGEQRYPVAPLTVPPPAADATPADLLTYEAVRLFVARAILAQPTFALTAANVPAVAQLCRRLDGIPLALELAAPQIKAMSIQTLVERLDQRFHLLDRGNRTALPRHQTLRASVDWSYALLAAPEQLLLQRLSIFAGAWTLAAAEAVCSDAQPNGLTADAVFTALLHLVEKSLVSVDEREDEPCYHMLETIRQYAYENCMRRTRKRHWATVIWPIIWAGSAPSNPCCNRGNGRATCPSWPRPMTICAPRSSGLAPMTQKRPAGWWGCSGSSGSMAIAWSRANSGRSGRWLCPSKPRRPQRLSQQPSQPGVPSPTWAI